MTYAESKEEIPDIDTFCCHACNCCNNDYYCPSECDLLIKARKIPYYRIVKCYSRHDGDMSKVIRYIKQTKVRYG